MKERIDRTSLFPSTLLDAFASSPDRPAFECGARVVTRREVLAMIGRLTSALQQRGFGPGRGVAIFAAVTPEAFAAQIAAHGLGCRVVGVRPGYTPRQLAYVLGMEVEAVLVDVTTATPELFAAAGKLPVFSLGPCAAAIDLLDSPEPGGALTVLGRPDDVAALLFTSGSTGQPKGCALTYRAFSAHWSWQEPGAWSPIARELAAGCERHLLFGTLASLVVLEFLAPCLLGGGTAVIPELDGRPLFPDAIERYRITSSIITVPRLHRMLDRLEAVEVDVGSLRVLMVSGSPLSPHRLASAVERLGPVVYQGYGQTEAGSLSMLTPADIARDPARALHSVGRAHPEVEMRVVNARGEPAAEGETGELQVRSPYCMASYWNLPDETSETLQDGWLRTRDLARIDAEGFLYLVGRSRDVILVNAQVLYAGAIERVLASHPDIDQAYVTGAPDEQTGEAVHAFVVPACGRALDHAALARWIRTELGSDCVPKTITEIASVPLAASGKPDKRALLALLGNSGAHVSGPAQAGSASAPSS